MSRRYAHLGRRRLMQRKPVGFAQAPGRLGRSTPGSKSRPSVHDLTPVKTLATAARNFVVDVTRITGGGRPLECTELKVCTRRARPQDPIAASHVRRATGADLTQRK